MKNDGCLKIDPRTGRLLPGHSAINVNATTNHYRDANGNALRDFRSLSKDELTKLILTDCLIVLS